jgi:hypothetical protein
MLKVAGFVFMAVAFVVAASGYVFISRYSISGSSTSVIEASLIQISHLRYVVAAILAAASAICFSAFEITKAVKQKW